MHQRSGTVMSGDGIWHRCLLPGHPEGVGRGQGQGPCAGWDLSRRDWKIISCHVGTGQGQTVVTMLECHCSLKYHSVVFTPLMISWTCANENDATHQSLFNRNVLLFKEMLLIYVWHWDWLIPPCFMLSHYMVSIAWQRSEGQMLGLACERTHHMMFLVHSCF